MVENLHMDSICCDASNTRHSRAPPPHKGQQVKKLRILKIKKYNLVWVNWQNDINIAQYFRRWVHQRRYTLHYLYYKRVVRLSRPRLHVLSMHKQTKNRLIQDGPPQLGDFVSTHDLCHYTKLLRINSHTKEIWVVDRKS